MKPEVEKRLRELDNRLYLLEQRRVTAATQLEQLRYRIETLMKEMKAKEVSR